MEFFRFEIARRLRQPMVWIFLLVNFLMILGALNSDNISVGGDLPNVNANAPWVVQQQVMLMTLIGLLITTAFMNTAAVRDFATGFDGILFTKPFGKFGYLAGRFFGSVLMASVPLLGVLLAVYVTGFDPFGTVRVGDTVWGAYVWAVLLFVLPNTLFAGAVTFGIASITRSQVAGFVAALGLLVLYLIAGNLLSDIDSEYAAALLDPFGFRAFSLETKYWTAVERNSQYLTFADATIALNRLIWVTVSLGIAAATYFGFSFTAKAKKAKGTVSPTQPAQRAATPSTPRHIAAPPVGASALPQLAYAIRTELRAVLTSRVFLVIMAFSVVNMLSAILTVDESYGTGNFPLTYLMIDAIRGSLYLFLGAIVMYYAGELVWRERDAQMSELFDAAPVATWVAPVAKFVALCLVPLVVLLLAICIGVIVQTAKDYTDFDLGQYFTMLVGIDWPMFITFAGLALLLQAAVNNKYLGYFAFLIILMATTFGMDAVGVSNNLFIFSSTPSLTFTAFNGLQPYLGTVAAYTAYWLLVTLLLVVSAVLLWVRGRGHTWRNRHQLVAQRFDGSLRLYSAGIGIATLLLGGFIYYQTSIVNEVLSDDERDLIHVEYERQYGRFAERPNLTITATDYNIELYPAERGVEATAKFELINKGDKPVDTLLVTLTESFKQTLDIPGAVRIDGLSGKVAEVYAFAKPIAPGQTIRITSTGTYAAKGIENQVSFTSVVPNGTFINNLDFSPSFGYQERFELSDRDDREKYQLAQKRRANLLPQGPCGEPCQHNYLGQDADWVQLSATVTTSADQIAIAPGSLIAQSVDEASGRRTFRYEVETPVLNFFSVITGRFEVTRERWGDVDLEVYHLPEHHYNVDKMMASMRASLELYSTIYGPYKHRQARIIEFPRYASFAQAFPGTMPYSESIGFIADLKDSTDIDMVTYVVAHEMAHQWWAHQVIGAGVQGATMLSETFAQYSALRVQEQLYGKPQMRKFLEYEMDRYLSGRGKERIAERPLMLDEGAGYIHYRKGSVIMYALAEYVGQDSVDAALKSFVERFGGQGPPYPTTRQFIEEHLRPRVPDSLQYVIADWFETITLYDNRVVEASAKTSVSPGSYEVTFTVETEKVRADSLGMETSTGMRGDYIDVGVFAEAKNGKVLGKPLWQERVRFSDSGTRTFTVTVDERPDEVAVDPDALLIDRLSNDNRADITFDE